MLIVFVVVTLLCFAASLWAIAEAVLQHRARNTSPDDETSAQLDSVRRWHGVAEPLRWDEDDRAWIIVCACGQQWGGSTVVSAVSCHETHVRMLQRLDRLWGAPHAAS
jgi:hypothetical protein